MSINSFDKDSLKMKAVVVREYGFPEVLQLENIDKPVPRDNEILVKVSAVGANTSDARIRAANFPDGFNFFARLAFGFNKPRNKILGGSFAGIVEAKGTKVTNFKVGDNVMGMCGFKQGAYAQYLVINENSPVIKKPIEISDEDAAAVSFGGTTALYFLRDLAKVKPGQKVLVNGASGAVGTNAVQIAKYFGAEVTGICSTDNIELVKSLGSNHVVDYKKDNIFKLNEKYDIVIDTVGKFSIDEGKSLLKSDGIFMPVIGSLWDILRINFREIHALRNGKVEGKIVMQGTAPERKEDLEMLCGLILEKKLKVVIDKVYKLEEVVEAHRRIDTGHKKGNIILKVM